MESLYNIGENVIFLDFIPTDNPTINIYDIDITLNKIYRTVDTDPLFVWVLNDIGLKIGYNTRYYKFESVKVRRKKKLIKILLCQ